MKTAQYTSGEARAIAANVQETRTVEFIISSSSRDRHRTVLNTKNWKLDNFNRNGIVGYQHNVYGDNLCTDPNPDSVIGKGRAYMDGENLIGAVTFEPESINPTAEKIFQKVLFGSLRATSVGFLPVGVGKYGEGEQRQGGADETYFFDGQELLEFCIVNIPSNPDAVVREMRDQASAALAALKRAFGNRFTFEEIERMTVGDAINQITGRKTPEPDQKIKGHILNLKRARELDLLR